MILVTVWHQTSMNWRRKQWTCLMSGSICVMVVLGQIERVEHVSSVEIIVDEYVSIWWKAAGLPIVCNMWGWSVHWWQAEMRRSERVGMSNLHQTGQNNTPHVSVQLGQYQTKRQVRGLWHDACTFCPTNNGVWTKSAFEKMWQNILSSQSLLFHFVKDPGNSPFKWWDLHNRKFEHGRFEDHQSDLRFEKSLLNPKS